MGDAERPGKKQTLAIEEIQTTRASRRTAMGFIGAAVGAVALAPLASAAAQEAEPLCSDSDPYDPGGYGRHCGSSGCSDSDPRDPGGRGVHCGRRCSDSDPYDPAGSGRHC